MQQTTFHVDHLHPASSFVRSNLAAVGMTLDEVEFALEHYNYLPNLALLPGIENIIKSDQPLANWLAQQPHPLLTRSFAILPDVNLDLATFRAFYEARRQMLVTELVLRLGGSVKLALAEANLPDLEELVTGESG